eukprot:11865491-Alexandrium_andersonii.AAC.1
MMRACWLTRCNAGEVGAVRRRHHLGRLALLWPTRPTVADSPRGPGRTPSTEADWGTLKVPPNGRRTMARAL